MKPGIRKRVGLSAVAAAIAALGVPVGAQATVTIGSNLNGAVDNGIVGPGTWAQITLPASAQAPGGLVSPVNGVITTWRVKNGGAPLPMALRVLQGPFGTDQFTGIRTSETRTPNANAITAFSTQLPISTGQRIGVDTPAGVANYWNTLTGALTYGWFLPANGGQLANGGAPRSPDNDYDVEQLLNADIEPNADFDIKKLKSLKNGRVKATIAVPNAGTLTANAKKTLKLRTATAGAPSELTLLLKATKAAKQALADDEKVKAKLKISFTPNFGAVHTETVKKKLKP